MCYKIILSTIFIFCILPQGLLGQNEDLSPYFNLKQHYGLIDYAINSGMIEFDHVLSQPYLAGELLNKFEIADTTGFKGHWICLLNQDVSKLYNPESKFNKKAYWNLGVTGSYELRADQNDRGTRYCAEVFSYYNLPYLVLMNKTVADQLFKYYDPLFYRDTNEWIYGRRL